MSTNYYKFNRITDTINSIEYQKKKLKKMQDVLVSVKDFSEFRSYYFNALIHGNAYSHSLERSKKSQNGATPLHFENEINPKARKISPVDQVIRDLFIGHSHGSEDLFDSSSWKERLKSIFYEPGVEPYKRVGNILELFKEWRKFIHEKDGRSPWVSNGYESCQQELRSLLNFFQLEEIKNCKGPIVDKKNKTALSALFNDYRSFYGEGMPSQYKLLTSDPQRMMVEGKIKRNVLSDFQKKKHEWCQNHHWSDVFLLDNKIFNVFRSRYNTQGSHNMSIPDANTAMLAFHHLMLETDPAKAKIEVIAKFLTNVMETLDQKNLPFVQLSEDIKKKSKEVKTDPQKCAQKLDDFINPQNIDFLNNAAFKDFDSVYHQYLNLEDPRKEMEKIPLVPEDKKNIGWDAWSLFIESARGQESFAGVYSGPDKKEVREAIFSWDYSKFLMPLKLVQYESSNTLERINTERQIFLTEDVPELENILGLVKSMGIVGDEAHTLIKNALENIKANDYQEVSTPLDEHSPDLASLFG